MTSLRSSFAVLTAFLILISSALAQATMSSQDKITVGFSPSGKALENILHAINSAQGEIKVALTLLPVNRLLAL